MVYLNNIGANFLLEMTHLSGPRIAHPNYYPLYSDLFPERVRVWRADQRDFLTDQGIPSTSSIAGIEAQDLFPDKIAQAVAEHYAGGGRHQRKKPTPFVSCSPRVQVAIGLDCQSSGIMIEAFIPRTALIIPVIGNTNSYDSMNPRWQLNASEFLILGSLKKEWIVSVTNR